MGLVVAVLYVLVCAAGLAAGCMLMLAGVRGNPVLWRPKPKPSADATSGRTTESSTSPSHFVASAAGALTIFALIMWVTRWIPVATVAAAAVLFYPAIRARQVEAARRNSMTQALASWTEMLRDHVLAGGGPMEAVQATAPLVSDTIKPEVTRLLTRIDRGELRTALDGFASDVDHPQGDMLVMALHAALAPQATGNFKELLGRIARLLRAEVVMRDRVETTRVKARTSARIVLGMSAAMLLIAVVSGAGVVAAFQDPLGQIVMTMVVVLFLSGWWGMARLARWKEPFRFKLRSGYRPVDRAGQVMSL